MKNITFSSRFVRRKLPNKRFIDSILNDMRSNG